MDRTTRRDRARRLLELHHAPELLVLPNIWDPLGARLLEDLGYPAVATASAAVAYSLGYDDGQRLSWSAMLEAVSRVVAAVEVPVTADIEAGYADRPEELADNVRQLLGTGAVGINLEDSRFDGEALYSIAEQQARIRAVRDVAGEEGVPLVINARTDLFIRDVPGSREERVKQAIERALAYHEAGADCFYPILLDDLDSLQAIREATGAPINVYASAAAPPMRDLEAIGISRLSLGPGMLKASLSAMKEVAQLLLRYGSYERFTSEVLTSDEIEVLVRKEKVRSPE